MMTPDAIRRPSKPMETEMIPIIPLVPPMPSHQLALGQWLVDSINRDKLSIAEIVAILQEAVRNLWAFAVPVSRNAGLNLWIETLVELRLRLTEVVACLQQAIGNVRGMEADIARNPRLAVTNV